ncbi:MAG: bifunctional oligoribonuclease/PAP phosphatase NrnA [Candidatus Moranbacteria bacterium]|nr:bifunctional oligoribonuclease/PAP phosphatase NrnA [Candidatus Moranbacteria bacterium]
MNEFEAQFRNIRFVIRNSSRVLLFAHSRPDADTVGANIALQEHIESLGKRADIACFDPVPNFAKDLFPSVVFVHPDEIDFPAYDAVLGADSINRGLDRVKDRISERTVTILIDHHPIENPEADIIVIDPSVSSASELVYLFFKDNAQRLSKNMATALLLGILGDTGNLQHSCTTTQTFAAASYLIQSGARLSKITSTVFSNNKISTLNLWGKALSRAQINPNNGMIYAAITEDDIRELGNPSTEDLYIASELLNHVPDAKFSLLFYQIGENLVRGSLRTEPHKGIDVSAIAKSFGGGGHKYASGFEIPGRIFETSTGWEVR